MQRLLLPNAAVDVSLCVYRARGGGARVRIVDSVFSVE